MSKDTLTICGVLLTGFIGLAGLLLHQSGSISELRGEVSALRIELRGEIGALRTEMRTEISVLRTEGQVRSSQIRELQQRVARIEGLLEGLQPTLASATPPA